MARHEVVIHENTGALRETAPYVGSYISKEQVALAGFAEAVGAKCGLPAIQVIAIIGGAFDAIAALEREALVRVRTDIGVVCGVITGSFPSADATFDPKRNALVLALRLDDTLRLDLTDVTPTIITDASLTKLRVDNLMDLEEERPMNLIHGQHAFRVAGFNMVLSDEGENALGTTFALVIDRIVTHQLFEAHTAELLPAGDYKFVVKSRAGDAAGPLQTSFRKVKYLRIAPVVPEPTITGAKTRGESEGSVNIAGGILDVVGANLETATAVELHSDVQPTGEASLWQTVPATYADGKLTTGELDFDEKPSDGGFVRVETAGGSALYPITYCAH